MPADARTDAADTDATADTDAIAEATTDAHGNPVSRTGARTGPEPRADAPATTDTPAGEDGGTPAERLLALGRAGLLAERYPEVRGLLREAGDAGLARAGLVLARLDAAEVLRAHPATPAVKVAVTGHGTLAPLTPALTAELARHGLLLRPYLADFDSYVFELSDPGSELYAFDADVVLCVLDPHVFLDELPTPWQVDDLAEVLDRKSALLAKLAAAHRATGRGTLVLNTVPLPRHTAAQLLDHPSRARLGALWREANARLLRLPETVPGVVVLDLDPLLAEGIPATDRRMSIYAKAHLTPALLAGYAREAGHLVRGLTGRTRKCLAVDLDDTVWGGVLGDDGIEGIEVGGSYRGEAFGAFQRVLAQLSAQGVLLAAVSKNDVEPVRHALREHPAMVLREEDFVRICANWRPKPDNLRDLAQDLNLGTDSFVFVDDSPYERGLVRHRLPEVEVVAVGREPAEHIGALLRDGWFDSVELTADDRARPARYREELSRQDFFQDFSSVEDYLRELGVRVRFGAAADAELPRISQLTRRTNQFNMTTERLQESEVRALAAGPGTSVLAVHAADRFGDNGLVGAVFTRRDGDTVQIDNFLLSCRVFARGIEQACLSAVLAHARDSGAREVLGRYRPSPKNGKVGDFYLNNGFRPDTGHSAVPGTGPDTGHNTDTGHRTDGGHNTDTGHRTDGGHNTDTGHRTDGGNPGPGGPGGAGGTAGTAVFRHDLAAIAPPPAHIHFTQHLGHPLGHPLGGDAP